MADGDDRRDETNDMARAEKSCPIAFSLLRTGGAPLTGALTNLTAHSPCDSFVMFAIHVTAMTADSEVETG